MKQKHLRHALTQLADEGVTRVFKPVNGSDWIIGVVGACSSTCCRRGCRPNTASPPGSTARPYEAARWLDGDRAELDRFRDRNGSAWPRTMTACRCSSPATPGICAPRPRNGPRSASPRPASSIDLG